MEPSITRNPVYYRLMGAISFSPLISFVALNYGCARDSLEHICPSSEELVNQRLVVTEFRGPQSGTYGEWIEVFNNSDQAINIAGVTVRVTELDGSNSHQFLIRDPNLEIAPRGYTVLGSRSLTDLNILNYSFKDEISGDFFYTAGGILELISCDIQADIVVYRGLPEEGTLALDGTFEPGDIDNRDSDVSWCFDERENLSPNDSPQTEIGIRGTPGERNPSCPISA